jgi:molybdopterin/thiamine biosynthesis adenylyltransferase
MAACEVTTSWSVRIPQPIYKEIQAHLFPGDGMPHAGAVLAGVATGPKGPRLLVREFVPARDGVEYVPGRAGRGHHRLTAEFVRDAALRAAGSGLAYLAIHPHAGSDRVGFSSDDLRSHERGYPALVDILGGQPAGALVFSTAAVMGDIWTQVGRAPVSHAVVVGTKIIVLRPRPVAAASADPTYDRQARLFGDAGQALLGGLKVGIIGAGGVGMLLVEYVSRLGTGQVVVIDPDRVETSNLPRLPGSRRSDARMLFQHGWWPESFREMGRRTARPKVHVAKRLAREANLHTRVDAIFDDVREPAVAEGLLDCDYLFLAANSDQARLLFNAICHQYLIPGAQVGAKVGTDPQDGRVLRVHSIVRSVLPGWGCLWCNQVISPTRLAEESASPHQRRAQRYVDDPDVVAPSVITLNASAAAIAANDFLFSVTGLTAADATGDYLRVHPIERDIAFDRPRRDPTCPECSLTGRLGRGDGGPRLPTFYRSS